MTSFTAHREVAVVQPGGKVTISGLSAAAGEQVEVLVIPFRPSRSPDEIRQRLKNSVIRDDDPFGPATSPDDWDALK